MESTFDCRVEDALTTEALRALVLLTTDEEIRASIEDVLAAEVVNPV